MVVSVSTVSQLPNFPLTCLSTAEYKSTHDVFTGQNTVIDFWTTKCTRCPEALDRLDSMAQDPRYSNVRFTSVVLDTCDGARNIIETPDDQPRWGNVGHYHLDNKYRNKAKEFLGFRQVPFYVVLNENGDIIQKGGKRDIDFEAVPGIVCSEEEKEQETECATSNAKDIPEVNAVSMERVFCMDEDF